MAVAIALQAQVLRACAEHDELFCDDDSRAAAAFEMAVDLVRGPGAHELTDLLSATIAAAPLMCPRCLEVAP